MQDIKIQVTESTGKAILTLIKTSKVEQITEQVLNDFIFEACEVMKQANPQKQIFNIEVNLKKPKPGYSDKVASAFVSDFGNRVYYRHSFIFPNWWKDARFLKIDNFKSILLND